MTDDHITIDASGLDGPQRQQLAVILRRASISPSLSPAVAALLDEAALRARLLIPDDIRDAEVRRRLDAALTPGGRVRARWPEVGS